MLTCPLCGKGFRVRGDLKVHTTSHTKEKPHKCPTCSAAFGLLGNLKKHIRAVHDAFKTIRTKKTQCPLCTFKCCGTANLDEHLRKHSADLPFSCTVPGCAYKTKYERSLRPHIRNVHNDARPYECSSGGCNYKAKSIQVLNNHLKTHSNEKPFACQAPGCDYRCKIKSSLAHHTLRVHTDEKPFKCSTCDFRTNHRQSLKSHQDAHGNIKRFQCQYLNCSFASHKKQGVQMHFNRKHRKQDVLCPKTGCSYRCGSIALLKKHRKIHELPTFKCSADSCSYSTKYKSSLFNHISRLHGNLASESLLFLPINSDAETGGAGSVTETLHCHLPHCDYQTEFPHHYDRHIKTHNPGAKRKFICKFCFSRFTDSYGLVQHVQRHLREKPYRCSHCNYTTGSSGQLRAHAGNIHHVHVTPRGKDDNVSTCRTCNAYCSSHSELVLHSMSHLRPVVVLKRLHINLM